MKFGATDVKHGEFTEVLVKSRLSVVILAQLSSLARIVPNGFTREPS